MSPTVVNISNPDKRMKVPAKQREQEKLDVINN